MSLDVRLAVQRTWSESLLQQVNESSRSWEPTSLQARPHTFVFGGACEALGVSI